jgi:hypothetical protein
MYLGNWYTGKDASEAIEKRITEVEITISYLLASHIRVRAAAAIFNIPR